MQLPTSLPPKSRLPLRRPRDQALRGLQEEEISRHSQDFRGLVLLGTGLGIEATVIGDGSCQAPWD